MVASWGNQKTVPGSIHGCFVDLAGNVWVAGNGDAMIQKYDPAGKLLMQIGQRGKFDSVDGTRKSKGNNSARDQLHMPAAVVIDPDNGDIFVSDGYGNRRVVVFDKDGKFLRQWGRQATDEETQKAVPGVFAQVVHCIHMSNAGLIYAATGRATACRCSARTAASCATSRSRTSPASCRTSAAPPGGWRSRPTRSSATCTS